MAIVDLLPRPSSRSDDLLAGPLRGELLGAEHLAERAAALARSQRPALGRKGQRRAPLLHRLRHTAKLLEDAYLRLSTAAAVGADIGPAGEWFLDNYHVVEEHIRDVSESLPRDYYRELPELTTGTLRGYPRVYEIAITLISHTEARLDTDNVDRFVAAFQDVAPLLIGELWAIPAMLRLGLIESVRRMTLRTVQRLDEVESADRWALRVQERIADDGPQHAEGLRAFAADTPPLTAIFVSRFIQQLRLGTDAFPPLMWLEPWIADEGLTPDQATAQATQHLALTRLMMSNSITSLRGIAQRNWRLFVEAHSTMERLLRTDPTGVYGQSTFATRDRCRHAVERIAKRTRHAETGIAERAVKLAADAVAANDPDPRRHHVGYFLIDRGLAELEREAGYTPKPGEWVHRWVLRHPNIVFVGGIGVVTAGALALALLLAGDDARQHWIVLLLFAAIPGNAIAVDLVNQLVTIFLPPRTLPRLDLESCGVPASARTVVVIPMLLDDVSAVDAALDHLESHFLANRDPEIRFALLSDFADAPTETTPDDAVVLGALDARIRQLNSEHAAQQPDAFVALHRPRRWNPQQGVWMGWERKRGKLAQFNQFLRGGARDAFPVIYGDVTQLADIRYVITLDADTVLPAESARTLIGTIAHPLNQAQFDPELGRITAGYGILQPRVAVSPSSAHRSNFAAVQSGHPGVDPYTTAVSDVYQDLFGEGSFTGKGIYDVDAFERATHGRFPENTLLSHDLIEGSYARAGLVTDVIIYDDYPRRYLPYTRRKHRWIRGDWQLLPWLTGAVPGPDGPEPNRLSLLSRWKIADNLRRSVVEIAQLVFLAAGWLLFPESPLRWTLLALGAIAAPWILSVLLAVLRPPLDRSWRAYYTGTAADAWNSAQQFAIAVTFLPDQARASVDAIVRTWWRMYVTHRRLLEWQTASGAEQSIGHGAATPWRAMGVAVIAAVALVAGSLAHALAVSPAPRIEILLATLPLGILWLASPYVAERLGARPVRRVPPISDAARRVALRYAARHWQYFDKFTTAATHWLAPDNFQDDPVDVVAMRTSPTNIGLQLLATVSAFDLGLLPLESMVERLEKAFATMAQLPRYCGHFYNWYDLHHLTVLEPGYISTVDSGNLAGHLVALRQACIGFRDSEKTPDAMRPRLDALANTACETAMSMDFRFLFDPSLKLFAIGFHPATRTMDASTYDLLASEARVASFMAIAKGDVPVEHWFHLGRGLNRHGGETALISWSGSMFEYLMPVLVMHSYPETMLGHTYHAALHRQIAWGRESGVPWGVSEAAYNVRDRHFTYQYRAFGVPDLALKRGLDRELVVAPYASALAAMVDPDRAIANLQQLEALGALGEYGFYDALDFTRPEPGQRLAIVHTWMAHHTGMILVALTNALMDRCWQRRFHTDAIVRAAALLLDERVPRRVSVEDSQPEGPETPPLDPDRLRPVVREIMSPESAQPHIALLGHTPFTTMVTHAGGGYTRYEELAVTRWRADGTRDNTGEFCYVKDIATGRVWSAGHQPVCARAEWYRALLATDRVTFMRADGEIGTRTEIAVVPQDSAEVRRVTITNHGEEVREVELTSYGEVVMTSRDTDRAHPAFSNLFVETAWHEWCAAITSTRRPRSPDEPPLWCVHVADTGDSQVGPISCETDRSRFIGRGRSTADPIVMTQDGPLSGTVGAVLDPVFALRVRLRVEPGRSASVAFTTLVATSAERAFELADRYHDRHTAQRALDLAWTAAQLELRELDITPADAAVFQDLAGYLLFPVTALGAPREERRRNQGSQDLLWANGISGDWPIVLAIIDSISGLPTLLQLFAAHRYWRRRGMSIDMVIVNGDTHSYQQELKDRITDLMLTHWGSGAVDAPGGIFLRRRDQLDDEALRMISGTARVLITCDGRSLARILTDAQLPANGAPSEADYAGSPARRPLRSALLGSAILQRLREQAAQAAHAIGFSALPTPVARTTALVPATQAVHRAAGAALRFDNGYGGVAADDSYHIRVAGDHVPPAPWTNVIANPHGGFVVSERGSGFSWAENSFFYRITPWYNDPVSDPPGDVLYLRDEQSGVVWSATPAPVRRDDIEYAVTHAPGTSTFQHEFCGIASELVMGLADDGGVKVTTLRVTNRGDTPRQLSLTAYVEWTLGTRRETTQHRVRTSFDPDREAIMARNHFDPQYAQWVAFCAMTEDVIAHTGDRCEFIGRNGSLADPAGLRGDGLSNSTGMGADPCAALQCMLRLAPGETREVAVLLGAAASEAAALQLIDRQRSVAKAHSAIADSVAAWTSRLTGVTVHTPDPMFDLMVNRWSLYQALSCRMWARSALYQSGGAYGFRDQLQDVMAFVYAEPQLAREHIVRCAGRQFTAGDVQHWWHPETGRGVRTRFSDDLVWLPYVVEHYVRVTGDSGVLDEVVPFLEMRDLAPHEDEIYDLPQVSSEHASVYEHCARALRRAATTGAHGLPLMGGGDWNDGMNRVGAGGKGESVWLAWFLGATLREFAGIAEARSDTATAADFRARATNYFAAVDQQAWDGAWYRRAYFDDGTPLGASESRECRIDSIAQSWSVISGGGEPAHQAAAMASLESHLVDRDARLIKLLTPPFDHMEHDPGYIKGYLPGVRENGAQYTHAALWAVLATALRGDGDKAFAWYQMINPLTHTTTPDAVARYKVEPYVVVADIYSTVEDMGRGGWTWYTGSASWMYRVGLEAILGFTKEGNTLRINPCVPAAWPEVSIEYRHGKTIYAITVKNPSQIRARGAHITIDGEAVEGQVITLVDDGKRRVVVVEAIEQA